MKEYLWEPLSAAAEVVLEVIAEDIHKRKFVRYVFVCPLFITHLCIKQLGDDVDLMFTIPNGLACWPNACHEYLLCTITLTMIPREWWRGTWVFWESIMACYCKKHLEGCLNTSVGRRPSRSSFWG